MTADSAASPLPEMLDTNKLEGLLDELCDAWAEQTLSDNPDTLPSEYARRAITEAFREVEAERDESEGFYRGAATERERHVETIKADRAELSRLRESLRELEAERDIILGH